MLAILARRRPLAMKDCIFSWRNGRHRARIARVDCGSPDCGCRLRVTRLRVQKKSIAGHPIAGVDFGRNFHFGRNLNFGRNFHFGRNFDCGCARDCGSPIAGAKKSIFFRAPWGPASRYARRGSARLASLASPAWRQPPTYTPQLSLSVRVGHGRVFRRKNIPPPENGLGAKQVPLRVRVGSERGPARRRGPGHSPARQVEGPVSRRAP
jgi:hypothetical protein